MRGARCLVELLETYPKNVLEVGVGKGSHVKAFLGRGMKVTGIDLQRYPLKHPNYTHVTQDFATWLDPNDQQFDAVWCCHVLEHVPNVGATLQNIRRRLKPGGWFGVVVPTDSPDILREGHMTLWTSGLLIYNLIANGWNCKNARWYTEGVDIGLIVQKVDDIDISGLFRDRGDFKILQPYFPVPVTQYCQAQFEDRF